MKATLLLVLLFSVSCSPAPDKDLIFRTDVLYEHTILMQELSTPEMLTELHLDMTKISKYDGMTPDEKISQLAAAYDMNITGTYNDRILQLEKAMGRMMIEWEKLQPQ